MTGGTQSPPIAPPSASEQPALGWFASIAAPLAVAAVLLTAYFSTLNPTVGEGDSAELQWMSPLLGVCHPPGYPWAVLAGYVVSQLPVGPSVAWRLNALMAFSAAGGAVLLYGLLLRVTRSAAAGVTGALALGLSSIYWMHAVEAEVYAFYALLLLGGLYALARWIVGGAGGWLLAAALLGGLCVSNRASEAFVLPVLALALLVARRWPHWRLLAVSLLLFAAPFGGTLAFYLLRERPDLLHARDDAIRDAQIDPQPNLAELPLRDRLREAVYYSLALKWAGRSPNPESTLPWQLDKYAWLLSGRGLLADRYPEGDDSVWRQRLEQGRGASIGLPALLLAAIGLLRWLRRPAWPLLGLGLFVANGAFYLWHRPPDNLEFTIPGLIGLALLAGLAAAGPRGAAPGWLRRGVPWLLVLAPLVLLGNHRVFDRDTPAEQQRRARIDRVRAANWPRDAALFATYDRAMTARYLIQGEAGRVDVGVFINRSFYSNDQRGRFVTFLMQQGRPTFLPLEETPPNVRAAWGRRTEPSIVAAGYLQAPPPRARTP